MLYLAALEQPYFAVCAIFATIFRLLLPAEVRKYQNRPLD
ncbi:hypothetical protein PFLA_a1300 [Pseudoalteromonas flavipulchra NCIMB 2033 = ATCC BAA-314]|nr:hypothetical protein [Pseudoalteromonas flavipulchra NCIMB 2033 = ATCC BAA-314]